MQALTPRASDAALAFALALFACDKKAEPVASHTPTTGSDAGCDFGDAPRCTKECDDGNQDSCANLAMTLVAKQGDTARARTLLEHACDAKSAMGCSDLGLSWERGWGVTPDPARAANAYERACDLGFEGGCGNLAVMLVRGTGRPRDLVRARALLEHACAAHDENSCENLRDFPR